MWTVSARASWRLARNSFGARPGRAVLMTATVTLASSLVVAVSCAIASAQESFESRLTQFLGAADARIVHPGNGQFDATLLETVRGWPEVEVAAGRFGASLSLIRRDAVDPATKRPRRLTAVAVGVDFPSELALREIVLSAGAVPTAPDEVVIDPLTAEGLAVHVGGVIEVQQIGEARFVRVAGIFARESFPFLQRPRIYVDRGFLEEASGRAGELSSLYMILAKGVDVVAFCARYQDLVPAAVSLKPAEKMRTGFDQNIKANRVALTIGTVLTFLSSAFIILIGMTTAITERQREMALLRCVGARRIDLFGSQLLGGLIFGVVGAATGVPLGIGLAAALIGYFAEYVPTGVTLDRFGVTLSIVGAVAAGLVGGAYPAVFAARVPPLRVMARQAVPVPPRQLVLCTGAGLALIGLQLLLLLPPDDETRFWLYVNLGLPAKFLGYFLLAPGTLFVVTALLAGPLARLLRVPVAALRGSLRATPFRHGFTGGALMVGIAILVETWASGLGIQRDWLEKIEFADGFAMRVAGIPAADQQRIAALPFVTETCPIGYLPARLADRQVFGLTGLTPSNVICVGFDPARFFAMNRVTWLEGTPEDAIPRLAAGDGAIVADRFLVAKDVGVGDRISLTVGRTTREFEIVGVVSSAGLDIATQIFGIQSQYMEFAVSCVFVDFATVAETFDSADAYILQVNLTDDVDDEEAGRRIEAEAPGVIYRSGRWIFEMASGIAEALMIVQSAIACVALVLASLAVGYIMAANLRKRRYEYGVLRAVGAGRWMLLRMILAEAGLLAITGAFVGTLLGFHLAWMDARHLRDLAGLPVGVAIPVGPIAWGWLAVVTLALLAALPGAVRIARAAPGAMVAAGRNG